MAHLLYMDGSNGNGITDARELAQYLVKYPRAMLDTRFMRSYKRLL